MNRKNCEELLIKGLNEMDIALEKTSINLLLDYLDNFHKWNQAYNLSAIRQPEKMVYRHLLDSLALVPFLQKYIAQREGSINLIDVGTGGGLPGVPLAIVFPEIAVTLLDSNGKKTRFLFQTAHKLGIKNISVENKRVEKFSPENKFAIVTSRAFASLHDMINGAAHLIDERGEYWAMKGVYPESELKDCSGQVELCSAENLQIPIMLGKEKEEERYLIRLKPC